MGEGKSLRKSPASGAAIQGPLVRLEGALRPSPGAVTPSRGDH